jgi:hypothetical protein
MTFAGRWSTLQLTGSVERERNRWKDSLLRLELLVLWEGPRLPIRDYHQVGTEAAAPLPDQMIQAFSL